MSEHLLIGLCSIFVLGAAAQWIAWRVRIPSILLLLVFGFLAGPVTGFVKPDELLGDLLFPVVSLSVAIILFEGGLTLRLAELRAIGRVVWLLVTLGAAVTWLLAAVAARLLIGLEWGTAFLLGAIVVVSGPTVVQPLLRHIRPAGRIGSILKWEAIVIDPLGATLALLVFEAIAVSAPDQVTLRAAIVILKTLVVGGLVGLAAAGLVIVLLRRYWVPDYLVNAVTLGLVLGAFTASNHVQSESGLLTVVVVGVVLANQHAISIKRIVEFKENLRVLLISTLFILLTARLPVSDLRRLDAWAVLFLAFLILVVRPLAAYICTAGSSLGRSERTFVSAVAPRGIVAAAVSSIFALRMEEMGVAQADRLVSLTFLVIAGTVAVYGLLAAPLAWRLGVAQPNPQGALIIGAHPLGRAIAAALKAQNCPALLVDSNYDNVRAARMAGLRASYTNVLSDYVVADLDLGGLGRLLAITPNDEVNSLAVMHFAEVFGRSELYQLPSEADSTSRRDTVSRELRGRVLFGPGMTYDELGGRIMDGAVIKKTVLTETFDLAAFQKHYGESAVPMFVIMESGRVLVVTAEGAPSLKPGQRLIFLADPDEAGEVASG